MNTNIATRQDTPSRKTPPRNRVSVKEWFILAGLLLLCIIPALGGTFRVVQLGSGAEVTPENARFFAQPIPVIIHIIGSIVYSVVGAFQFIRGTRRWRPRLHQKLGPYLLLPAGFAVALSGLWMTLFYPWPEGDGVVLYVMRLVVGIVMTYTLVMGYLAFRRKSFKVHGAWMLRAYALAMGAGTQAFTHMPWFIFVGMTPGETPRAVMMGAGWLINIVLAEWVIQTHLNPTSPKSTATHHSA